MQYRQLGQTGLRVSEIGFGCAGFWGKKIFSDTDAIRLVHTAAERGVTFFDTGGSYSGGIAERRLGQALAGMPRRQDIIISTKIGTCLDRYGRAYKDFSPRQLEAGVENSLRSLGVECIPLVQIHGPYMHDLTDEVLQLLTRLRAQGKVLHWGVNSPYEAVIEHVLSLPIFETVMINYNILHPWSENLIQSLNAKRIGILAAMPLAGALYHPRGLWSVRDIWYALRAHRNYPADKKQAKRYRFLNTLPGWTAAQAALAWVLSNAHISSAVIGTTRLKHLLENLEVSGKTMDAAILQRIRRAQQS